MDERSLFFTALQGGSASERGAVLKDALVEDPAQRSRIENWLQAHDSIDGWALRNRQPASMEADRLPRGFLTPSRYPGSLGALEQYEVIRGLAADSSCVTLEAFDTHLDRIVVIKLLSAEQQPDPDTRERFLDKARRLAGVLHPNIMRVLDVGERGDTPYAVWECVDGQSLSKRIASGEPFTVPETRGIGFQLAEGLAAIHSAGLIHRTVNPTNIYLCGGDGFVKLSTLGMLGEDDAYRVIHGRLGASSSASPGQANRHAIDHRADLYDLGVVLYTMAAGTPAYSEVTAPELTNGTKPHDDALAFALPPIDQAAPQTPSWLANTITQLLAKNPGERFQSAQDLAKLFNSHKQSPGSTPKAKPSRWRRVWLSGLILLALPVALCGMILVLSQAGLIHGRFIGNLKGMDHAKVIPDDPTVDLRVQEITSPGERPIPFFKRSYLREVSKRGFVLPPGREWLLTGVKDGVQVFERRFRSTRWRNSTFTYRPAPPTIDPLAEPNKETARWVLSRGGEVRRYWNEGELVDRPIHSRLQHILLEEGYQLESVRLCRVTLSEIEEVCAALARCTRLAEIDVAETELTGEYLSHLAKIPSLERLRLTEMKGASREQFLTLRRLPKLQELSLSYSTDVREFCAAASEMPRLRVLSIDDSPVTDEMLRPFGKHRGLESLAVHSRFVSDAAVDDLIAAPSLTRLAIRSPRLTDAVWTKLASMNRLESLTIGGYPARVNDNLKCEGVQALEGLSGLSDLTLIRVAVTDNSALELEALSRARKLKLEDCSWDGSQRPLPPGGLSEASLKPANTSPGPRPLAPENGA